MISSNDASISTTSPPTHLTPQIGPSMLASDLSNLTCESLRMMSAGADYLHLDVMDGHFVPNLTFGAPVIKCLRRGLDQHQQHHEEDQHQHRAYLDAHLMVSEPAKWIIDMKDAGVDRLTFHIEAIMNVAQPTNTRDDDDDEVVKVISAIRSAGMKVGIALRPATPITTIFPYAHLVDLILIMTVEPGFGGQAFMTHTLTKIAELRAMHPCLDIEVDGGLGLDNIDLAAQAGANLIVAGSSVFRPKDVRMTSGDVIVGLRDAVKRHIRVI